MFPSDIQKYIMHNMSLNSIMSDFKDITNERLRMARSSQYSVSDHGPLVTHYEIPRKTMGGTQIYDSEANAICNDFLHYYQRQGYRLTNQYTSKNRACELRFETIYNKQGSHQSY